MRRAPKTPKALSGNDGKHKGKHVYVTAFFKGLLGTLAIGITLMLVLGAISRCISV